MALLVAGTIGLLFALSPRPEQLLRAADARTAGDTCSVETVAHEHEQGTFWRHLERKVRGALVVAGEEFFEMGRYLVLGSLLAAAMQAAVPQALLLQIGRGPVTSVLAMLLLAFVLSVCSTVDAFLALAFVNSFTSGSILAFLVFGPMVDIKSMLMLAGVFRRRVVAYLVLLPLSMILFLTVLINLNLGW
jgi:hypothetical protein